MRLWNLMASWMLWSISVYPSTNSQATQIVYFARGAADQTYKSRCKRYKTPNNQIPSITIKALLKFKKKHGAATTDCDRCKPWPRCQKMLAWVAIVKAPTKKCQSWAESYRKHRYLRWPTYHPLPLQSKHSTLAIATCTGSSSKVVMGTSCNACAKRREVVPQ